MSRREATLVAVLGAVSAVVVGFGIWGLTVLLSGVGGAGTVHKDQNKSTNREHWSATYNTDWTNLQADKTNISTLQAVVNGSKGTEQDTMNLHGMVLNCAQDVATYNADAQNVLGHKWLPSNMPQSVNVTDFCSTTVYPSINVN